MNSVYQERLINELRTCRKKVEKLADIFDSSVTAQPLPRRIQGRTFGKVEDGYGFLPFVKQIQDLLEPAWESCTSLKNNEVHLFIVRLAQDEFLQTDSFFLVGHHGRRRSLTYIEAKAKPQNHRYITTMSFRSVGPH